MIGQNQFVLVRTYSAGVHVGRLVSREGKEVVLRDAHRIWRWYGANTITELARSGASMDKGTRISERSVGHVILTECIEIHEISSTAETNLTTPRWL